MRSLTARYPADYAQLLLDEPVVAASLQLELQERRLPVFSREVDFVARVRLQGRPVLLLLEFQTRWEVDVLFWL